MQRPSGAGDRLNRKKIHRQSLMRISIGFPDSGSDRIKYRLHLKARGYAASPSLHAYTPSACALCAPLQKLPPSGVAALLVLDSLCSRIYTRPDSQEQFLKKIGTVWDGGGTVWDGGGTVWDGNPSTRYKKSRV